jgi:hypothetical protein
LHPGATVSAALPFSSLVIDVPLEFFHRNLAGVASHGGPFVSRIALAIRNQDGSFLLASIREKLNDEPTWPEPTHQAAHSY